MVAMADSSKKWYIVLGCTICGPLGPLSLASDDTSFVYAGLFVCYQL